MDVRDPLRTRPSPPHSPAVGAVARLLVLSSPDAGTAPVLLARDELTIGRHGHAVGPLALADIQLSRAHATFRPDGAGWKVCDLESRNGTFVNGTRVRAQALAHGDVVRCGTTLLLFEVVEGDETALEPEAGLLRGPSVALQRIRARIGLVAAGGAPVLVLGETGAGKELVAAELHRRSGRAGKLVAVNCASIPENLLEIELFGHSGGAGAGAVRHRDGLIVEAHGGTLFLDEPGELLPAQQERLLRVLSSGAVRPVGSSVERTVDVRVIAATHRDLAQAVAEGRFRADLLARLGGVVIRVPPLRERKADILPLARHFLARCGAPAVLRPGAAEALLLHAWPYNVRELEQVMSATAIRAGSSPVIRSQHLPEKLRPDHPVRLGEIPLALRVRPDVAPDALALAHVLRHFKGNVAQVAEYFGRDRREIYRWTRQHGLEPYAFR